MYAPIMLTMDHGQWTIGYGQSSIVYLCFFLYWPLQHLIQACTLWHHRIYRVFLLHAEFQYNGTMRLACPLDGILHLFTLGHKPPRDAVRLCEFYKIRCTHVHSGITLVKEKFLPLANHAKEIVVHDRDFHVRAFLNSSCQFCSSHLESAVARDCPNFLIFRGEPRANGGGETKPHRPRAARGQPAIRFFQKVILCCPHLMLTHVRSHDGGSIGRLPNIG